ncbi:TIP41-like family protein [Hirsutella rhossiliensis]|uniref:TIP41-like family domain-containing protein n=1 Tax=Hirsutella rhossiliensis TaxID=111463 RepID=A0A9P8SIW4_9HYPO|nr:TIP41-like family domain-containing protein [Hirsutella rhossiliensis]KAH0963035.1 TIP41-like family domain-containing protein [Hirsutella rhossiliensis]
MNHAPHPNEPFPTPQDLAAATTTHAQGRFRISTRKLPISKAGAIDAMTDRIGIPMPEMIFGDNLVHVAHAPSGWSVAFTTPDALDAVDKTDRHMLKVAYARDWESTRENTTHKIKEVVKPYDWSYSTTYCGTVGDDAPPFRPTDRQIPIELLKRRDPILFFDEVVLYESELDDNGISIYSAKLRVHQKRMLLLCRLFMRLDNVVVRIRDTRLYVDFETDEVLREYTAKEATFADVKKALLMSGRLPDDVTIGLRDPNVLDPLLAVTERRLEAVNLREQSQAGKTVAMAAGA